MDLIGVELKFRHIGMAGHDAFGERLAQRFDRITVMQRSKRRGSREFARRDPIDRVASGAMFDRKGLAPLFGRRNGRSSLYQHQSDR